MNMSVYLSVFMSVNSHNSKTAQHNSDRT